MVFKNNSMTLRGHNVPVVIHTLRDTAGPALHPCANPLNPLVVVEQLSFTADTRDGEVIDM